ncbi:DUF975 family protein [Clostridium felsineum]|uniref:Uncharacterized protein n=1 Tax=Clostridium felsineum TaxID=36839 RepID=A0A1S8MBW4_9CLOT|nr:DUF975 family protein [Clostridium felsineum]URZ04160.1 hypothetical protein CLAUR_042480 [Clostridium felsineum]URZ07650.1 hypothetical protein CLROS_029890 [Clostridium felsineum]URZ12681.1 hypothetical protein CROST_034040 [Clostridium felsineum]
MEQKRITKNSSELRKMAREQLKGNWGAAALLIFVFGIVSCVFMIPYVGPTIIRLIIGGALTLGFKSCFVKVARGEKFQIEDLFSGFKNFGSSLLLQLLIGIFTFLWALIGIIPFIIIIVMIGNNTVYDYNYGASVVGKMLLAYLLLIVLLIPAIIAAYRYSMAYYILNDHPEMGSYEAIVESKKMMKGNKLRLFILQLSFIGWNLLSLVPVIMSFTWTVIAALSRQDGQIIAGIIFIIISYILLGISHLFIRPYMETAAANFYLELTGVEEEKNLI